MLLFAGDYWRKQSKYIFLLLGRQASILTSKYAQKRVWTFMCHAGITSKLLNSGLVALPKVKFRKEILFVF
jgi:hypothetical protein